MVCDGTYRHIFLVTSGPEKNSFTFNKILRGRKMARNAKPHSITIDLNQFKLHIELKNKIELTLHFNSPSRRFYLSVIALVVNEMKRLGKITSIHLEGHHELLALLNETIGESAGSSDKENLLPRIYRKWQHALPNLEEAPLFAVLGRKKGYEEGVGKTYPFTEAEKDSWANLFEYKGSHENVRLKFAIDKIGATLDDVVIKYKDSLNGEAWEKFISSLKEEKAEPLNSGLEKPEGTVAPLERSRTLLPGRYRWVALMAAIAAVLGTITLAIWKTYLHPDPADVASIEKMAFPLPDVPSIAVLPFVNLSEDPKQEFLSDGITEIIITALSKVPRLFVISRQSTFFYKGKPIKVKQLSEELGVQYVLDGSVQRSADRIRINAQLIDALTGRHLLAERYERDLKDIFALQDEITMKILTAVRVKLTEGGISSAYSKHYSGKQSLDCLLKHLEGARYRGSYTIEGNNVARRLLEEAISMCPENPLGYSYLGAVYLQDYMLRNTKSPRETLEKALELTQKAVAMDDSLSYPHGILSSVYLAKKDYERAIAEGERAVALDPGDSLAYFAYATALLVACRPEEAVPALKKGIQRAPDNIMAHVGLGTTYSLMGRGKEARAEAQEILRINPMFSPDQLYKTTFWKDPLLVNKFVNALRKAGMN
jgi:adenylate cyclase